MAPPSSPHFRTPTPPPPPPLAARSRTEAPHRRYLTSFRQSKKFRSIVDIIKVAKYAVVSAGDDYYDGWCASSAGRANLTRRFSFVTDVIGDFTCSVTGQLWFGSPLAVGIAGPAPVTLVPLNSLRKLRFWISLRSGTGKFW